MHMHAFEKVQYVGQSSVQDRAVCVCACALLRDALPTHYFTCDRESVCVSFGRLTSIVRTVYTVDVNVTVFGPRLRSAGVIAAQYLFLPNAAPQI